MLKFKWLPAFLFIAVILSFIAWNSIFSNQEWVRLIGINGIQLLVGALSFICLCQEYIRSTGRNRNFWLLLSLGLLFSFTGNFIWLYFQVTYKVLYSNEFSSVFWVLSYLTFLLALMYRTQLIGFAFSSRTYTFNLIIYMLTASAITYHFLIQPFLMATEASFFNLLLTIGYQLVDLGILFFSIILYYRIQSKKEERVFLFVIAGLLLQVTADSLSAFLSIEESYRPGSFLDLMWISALLLIGCAAYYHKESLAQENERQENNSEQKRSTLPYVSIVSLLVLGLFSNSWHFNALSIGLLFAFLLVLGHQFIVIRRNSKLMTDLSYAAYYDSLTGLANRVSFIENMKKIIDKTTTDQVAFLLIDLDRFKLINDTLGHHVGDEILKKTAIRLKDSLSPDTQIFRLGGDEFVITLAHATERIAAETAIQILASFQKPFSIRSHEIKVTTSIGISLFPGHGTTSEDLLKNADAAMYLSKEKGKNMFSFYNAELNKNMMRKMDIENHLVKAMELHQLSLCYQPKVNLKTQEIVGMEALLRWKHPEMGWISPAEFIPVAEETGQIVSIGKWVLEEACRQNKLWQDQGLPSLKVSVNVSVLQFQNGKFIKTVKSILRDTQLPPQFLELEITESIMQNIAESTEVLEQLGKLGVKTSIDDFGTGYSSLHVLQKLPIDTLKIDKAFIDELEQNCKQPMVKAIIDLALNLGLNIVAEGIESANQMESLIEMGCPIGQGYLFSRPIDSLEFEKLIGLSTITLETKAKQPAVSS
ncbi:putative bifunctional diguanylate cyclase/phosphodiesterase [Planococcus halotolerans]|uniref:GGDEF-domain containing protein n=1 Tax=Planococcus halotolerans TaxID=2233542 RepID=A0A365KUF6_9BACL|nr:EAL domain-containing protein [Planococcus halotolerans]QHJ71345.1 EAL domain-containing protein [Planococcus halotolerans]RAZ76799.1 GGDEF-domain containing protein [Planococcus halotolerans]